MVELAVTEPSPIALAFDLLAAAGDSPSGLALRQRRRLDALLHSAGRLPYFQRALKGADPAHTPLTQWPVLRKAHWMQHLDEAVADPAIRRSELQRFCADTDQVGRRYLGRYWVWESSGSTGEPGIYVQDDAALAVYDQLELLRRRPLWPLARLMDPLYLGERFALVGVTGGHFASYVSLRRVLAQQPWLAHWHAVSLMQPVAQMVDELNRLQPTLLATYPTAALLLAEQAQAGRLHARPREIWAGGETLTDAMRQHIEQAFGPVLRNSYGASEFLPIAFECSHGRLHVNSDWVLLEPVDAAGRPVPPGQPSHTTLLTNLANHLQPIVRLDIGDRIALGGATCGCRSPLPVVQVQGRCDDALVLRDPQGQRVTLLPMALTQLMEEHAGVFDFQLRQTGPAALELGLGPGAPHDGATRQRCLALLARHAAAQGLPQLKLACRRLAASPMARSGKHQRIVALPDRQ